jgi:hypothetical protein
VAIAGELGITRAMLAGRLHRRKQAAAPQDAGAALRTFEQNLGYERVTQGGCRWVIGDPAASWHWCGETIVEGAYCAEHAARSYNTRGKGS